MLIRIKGRAAGVGREAGIEIFVVLVGGGGGGGSVVVIK